MAWSAKAAVRRALNVDDTVTETIWAKLDLTPKNLRGYQNKGLVYTLLPDPFDDYIRHTQH